MTGKPAVMVFEGGYHGSVFFFATGGDPGWTAWDRSRPVMVFDHPGAGVQLAPREKERSALDALRALRAPRAHRRS